MANFLTDGRMALIAALKEDTAIAALVKSWQDWGPGLRKRFSVEPAYCPLLAIYPASGDLDYRYDIGKDLPQDIIHRLVVTENPVDAEEIIVPIIRRVELSAQNSLGLASEGLANISVQSWRWDAWRDAKSALVIWDVTMIVRLLWIRRRHTS